MSIPFHPAANIFPLLEGSEFEALVEDIRNHGLREPILFHRDGSILDGRNRYRACRAAGVEPRGLTWEGEDSEVVALVLSLNLHRRHLGESQRAMVGEKVWTMRQGARTDLSEISGKSQEEAAEMLSISADSIGFARQVATKGAPELIAAVEAGEVSVFAAASLTAATFEEQRRIVARGEAEVIRAAKAFRARKMEKRRGERTAELARISNGNQALALAQRFPVLYVDPPWRYEHTVSESRAIENQYPTLSLDELMALPVAAHATDDAILFLWATSPKLAEAITLIDAWGFRYRTSLVWDKERLGMGYWFRQQHELLLLATCGEPPAPPPDARPASVLRVPRGDHSEKPVEVYEVIERMFPALPRCELFARARRDGWHQWGNEVEQYHPPFRGQPELFE